MKIAVFSTKPYDETFLKDAGTGAHELAFFDVRLDSKTAQLAENYDAVCVFVNDDLGSSVINELADYGVRLIALRCAGFNNVDLEAAARHNMTVLRVPAYSPHAVAEHTVALMLALNRKVHRSYNRVREGNFSLNGLLGFDLHQKTVGIIGTGKIGTETARILNGFGCKLLAYDVAENDECREIGVEYVNLDDLFTNSDIVTIHCPLNPDTHHLIDAEAIEQMRDRVMLINTSRGAVIDTRAVIDALKRQKIGYLGLDVYEEEGDLFFQDLSDDVIQDDVFARLLTFTNVIITGHQAFFTEEAMRAIAETTINNISQFEVGSPPAENQVKPEKHVRK